MRFIDPPGRREGGEIVRVMLFSDGSMVTV